ncbi:hypothetical protein [Polynucleobacter sp. AP-Sving-400A-A2]|uniref:hypothetical protein n=1 Tax=Polynucleobacter sp. AP-Sving-400A-A2 TaxID=2081049 RepID=UPI001BFE135C|nr:hypothetical protein [Polynucleobacter sp. AP-Sving-400A-A2]QWE15043.1 hypothetical protein C2758_02570 [Polynucleobacter sp. AP-Sving-400A-A2]
MNKPKSLSSNISKKPSAGTLQGYREAEFKDSEFLQIRRYSDHPEVYAAADLLYKEFAKTRLQIRNKEKYPRDSKKLIASIWMHEGAFRFTTKAEHFSKGKRKQVWMTNRTLDLFNCMRGLKWVKEVKGAIPPYLAKNEIGFSAIYTSTDTFKTLLRSLTKEDITINPDLPCVLRKNADKQVIEEPESFYSSKPYKEHQSLIQAHLERLRRHKTCWADDSEIDPIELLLTRQFTEDFAHGGRWYCNFQNKPKTVRNSITIDGKSVGSLDITQCHPMLILRIFKDKESEDGLFSSHNEDVYQVAGFDHLNRDIRKKAVNTLFNANTETEAIKSLRNTNWWIDGITSEVEIETYRGKKKRWGSPIFKDDDEVKKFIGNFKLMHPDFVDAVGSGIGLQLQGFDGAVTHQVLKFADAIDLPLIPIHEEYLVPEDKQAVIEEILRSSMQVVLQKAGQYGNLNAKWTDSNGWSSKVKIKLADSKVGRFS